MRAPPPQQPQGLQGSDHEDTQGLQLGQPRSALQTPHVYGVQRIAFFRHQAFFQSASPPQEDDVGIGAGVLKGASHCDAWIKMPASSARRYQNSQ